MFYKAGEFPNGNDPEFELASEAQSVYQSGDLPILLRTVAPLNKQLGLPFWPAAFINANAARSILLIIPLLSIIVPLIRIFPMLYNWSVRRRLLHWYRQLKTLENTLDHPPTPDQVAQKLHELERIDRAVSKIRVPLYFSDRLYDLRGHIDLVRQRLAPLGRKIAAE